jgi:hypothetical protein
MGALISWATESAGGTLVNWKKSVREDHKEIGSKKATTLTSEESKLRGICASGIK